MGAVATVLLVSVVALMLALVIASAAVTQLSVTSRLSNAEKARNAAESAVQAAIAKLMEEPEWGGGDTLNEAEVSFTLDGAEARLTFHPLDDASVPVSLNNVSTDTPQYGWGKRLIPAEAVQLVGVGKFNGVTRTVEAIVHTPRFPYVIATSGKFNVEGPLEVGVLPRGSDPNTLDNDELLPGHLASNSAGNPAISLNPEVVVHGDLLTSGHANQGGAKVWGEVREGDRAKPLPKIDVRSYDPRSRSDVTRYDTLHTLQDGEPVSGWNRAENLVVNGDLALEAGILFVEGSLTVSGGVKGKGAVITTGPIIVAHAELEADHQVAMLSQGDITISGQNGKFRGLVYTEGNFKSNGVQLIGAFVANGRDGKGDVSVEGGGVVALDPSLSFEKGWLTMERRVVSDEATGWDETVGPRPTLYVESEYLGPNDKGEHVVKWSYTAEFSQANGVVFDRVVVRDYYDSEGERLRYEVERPSEDPNFDPGPGGSNWPSAIEISLMVDDELLFVKGVVSDEPPLKMERVKYYEEVASFSLDFSEFLSQEERMRVLLWVEH
ncbi:MAG: hypothetical protein KC800_15390 [Candidatus Eremiobacteraeota bacterium]|nr:hypothetical protein [Candidatus Eremiobacteraeota bacterium]